MTTTNVPVTFKCPKCGGGTLSIEDKARDNSAVSCTDCGVKFDETWGQIKDRATKKVGDAAIDALLDGLGKGWKRK